MRRLRLHVWLLGRGEKADHAVSRLGSLEAVGSGGVGPS